MNTYEDIINYIDRYTDVSSKRDMSLYFSDLKRIVYKVDLTSEQICSLIDILHNVWYYFINREYDLDINFYFWDFLEDHFFLKVRDVPDDQIHKIVRSVKTLGVPGVKTLMRTNIYIIGSFKLFVALYLDEESQYQKMSWIRMLNCHGCRISNSDSKKIEMLFNYYEQL